MYIKVIPLHFILFFLLLFNASAIYSQSQEIDNVKEDTTSVKKPKTILGKLWKLAWGDELKSSVTAMPIGLHTDFEKHATSKRSTINGLHEALYFAGNYKSVELAVFQNSFGDPVVALFYKRAWNFTKRFSLNVVSKKFMGIF